MNFQTSRFSTLAVAVLVASGALAANAAASVGPDGEEHGIANRIGLDAPKCEFEMIEGTMTASYNDGFGDTTELLDAFVTVQAAAGDVRVPAVGMHLEIIEVTGNTTATVGASLPVRIGPSGSTLSGLPGINQDGEVTFRITGYTIQPADPDRLRVLGTVVWGDLCDDPDTEGCDTGEQEVIVVARTDVYHPRIALEKTADISNICEGQEELVTYTYTVSMPEDGNVPLGVELTDDAPCEFPVFLGGDENMNDLLDPGEVWTYECTALVSTETTNNAVAFGESDLIDCTATDEASFTITADPAPVCEIDGMLVVCPGATDIEFTVTELLGLPDATFEWFLTGAGEFCSAPEGPTVCVNAGEQCGSTINLRVVVTAGNCQSECFFTTTINDLELPTIVSCPTDRMAKGCPGDVPTFGTPVFDDNCDFEVIEGEPMSSGTCPTVWTKTWFARDDCGNESERCTQTITVVDSTRPVVISCPADDTIEGCPGDVPTFGMPVFDDNCNFEVIEGEPMSSGECPTVWTMTWFARDECGNESVTCTQTIRVDDTIDPVVVSCPDDETLEGCPDDVPTFGTPAFSDDCNFEVIESEPMSSGECPTIWTKTWFARDVCGNESAPCTQTITVDDTTLPEITTCPPNETIDCEVTQEFTVEAEDNCTAAADVVISCGAVFDPPGSGSFMDLGDGTFSIVFTEPGTATVTCVATDACDNDSEACVIEIVGECPDGGEFCSFTQGYWGNAGGHKFGLGTLELIELLIGDEPLVIGVPGERSFTIAQDAAQCIIDRLPGGGPDRTLPDGLGDDELDLGDCQTSSVELPVRNGRFRNNLLSQTIAMSLNVRINTDVDPTDPDGPIGPGSFDLQEHFCTAEPAEGLTAPDPDAIVLSIPLAGGESFGITVTTDTIEMSYYRPLDIGGAEQFWISTDVLDALDTLYGSRTVNDLLALANRALAGLSTEGASPGQIKDAVDTINNAFDECRMVVPCGPAPAEDVK